MQRSQLRASESENQATRWSPTRTLKTYVRSRRLAPALDALAHTDERILEIARYRKSHQSIPFLRKVRVDEDYLCHLHGGVSLEPDVSVQPARFMVGLSTRFFGSDSEKNNFGAKLPKLRGAFMPRLPEIAREQAPTGTVSSSRWAHTPTSLNTWRRSMSRPTRSFPRAWCASSCPKRATPPSGTVAISDSSIRRSPTSIPAGWRARVCGIRAART